MLLTLALSLFFLGLGFVIKLRPPKNINHTFGFRTKAAKTSQESWNYANALFANYLLAIGSLFSVINIVVIVIFETLGLPDIAESYIGVALMLIEAIIVLVGAARVNKKVKKYVGQ